MKTLDEKSVEFTARLCNQTGIYTKGEMETAYVIGASENETLSIGECGTFGKAIESIKRGNLVTRKGWNGKGMFIFMRPYDELNVDFVANKIRSLPNRVKDYYRQDLPSEGKDDVVSFTAYICLKAADGTIVNGWFASQTDIFANDWMLFEF